MLTRDVAQVLIDVLWDLGVSHFCIAPGSRSTPIALSIAEHPKAIYYVHFDERALGFYALGLAKALKKPVAILVTTGTALANLYPAIMEAHHSQVPLIVLSADRPIELRDCGANQTADQVKFFEGYVRFQVDLGFLDCPINALVSTISYACAKSMQTPRGPIHINCMIREPFLEKKTSHHPSSCVYEEQTVLPTLKTFQIWAELLNNSRSAILLLGSNAIDDLSLFKEFATKLNFPIFSDILSGGRMLGNFPLHIEYSDLLLKASNFQVSTILQIGNRITSKTTLEWINSQDNLLYLLVTDSPLRDDPLHKVSRKMQCSTHDFIRSISPLLSTQTPFPKKLKEQSLTIKAQIPALCKNGSEPGLIYQLKEYSSLFFFANSMPIRDADLFFFPDSSRSLIFANRGTSGIDGNLATASGIAEGLNQSIIACIGDLSFLHDLNSLAFLSKIKVPIFLIVINNQGGAIFSFLPVAKETTHFDKIIATTHSYEFQKIAQMFSIEYLATSCVNKVKEALEIPRSILIEYKSNREQNFSDHQQIYEFLRRLL